MAAVTASLTTRWDVPAFGLPPTAHGTGPFTSREFLGTWWRHRAEPGDELLLVASDQALLPLLRRGDLVAFLGEQDLTDYHSPRGTDLAEVVASLVAAADPEWRFDLNSVPGAGGDPPRRLLRVGRGRRHGHPPPIRRPGALPDSHDRYLADLDKKQRHEVRRKRRRFAEELGEPRLSRSGR